MMRGALVLIALSAVACAKGGSGNPPTDASATDAPRPVDAPLISDARVDAQLVDAPPMIDAAIDAPSGPFCANNNQCTVPGECCLAVDGVGLCIEGTAIGNDICIPPL